MRIREGAVPDTWSWRLLGDGTPLEHAYSSPPTSQNMNPLLAPLLEMEPVLEVVGQPILLEHAYSKLSLASQSMALQRDESDDP